MRPPTLLRSHIITNIINGFGFGNVIGLQNADFSIVSNALTETNIIVQAVPSTPPSIGRNQVT